MHSVQTLEDSGRTCDMCSCTLQRAHRVSMLRCSFLLLHRRRMVSLPSCMVHLTGVASRLKKAHPAACLPAHLVVCLHAQDPKSHIAAGDGDSGARQAPTLTC